MALMLVFSIIVFKVRILKEGWCVVLALVATFRLLGMWMKKVAGMTTEQGYLSIKWPL
jgi:hypothetical protein